MGDFVFELGGVRVGLRVDETDFKPASELPELPAATIRSTAPTMARIANGGISVAEAEAEAGQLLSIMTAAGTWRSAWSKPLAWDLVLTPERLGSRRFGSLGLDRACGPDGPPTARSRARARRPSGGDRDVDLDPASIGGGQNTTDSWAGAVRR